ncbi:MAG: hypothetical protein ABI763_07160 [Bacteroidota bacterium]
MRKLFVVSTIIAVSAIASCTKDKADDPNACIYKSSEIRYNGLISSIINTSCANNSSCHGTNQTQEGGGEYTSYDLIKEKVDNGSFKSRVFDLKDMPQGSSLSACDLKKLKEWYDAGAPQ